MSAPGAGAVRRGRLRGRLAAMLLAVAAALPAAPAWAHKSSDAYLQLDASAQRVTVRWDIALRDLDVALDLDANDDGRLTMVG